ncbi:MAG: hypothetical protein ACXQTD_03905 [Candidatus Syntropharchaeia archaeon]
MQIRQKKLEKILNNHKRKLNWNYFIAIVEELVPDGREEVYDVRIPGINAFDANGFVVHNCGEQPLLPYESCNLGSINLSRMVRNGEVDWERLGEVVRKGVHFLDNVIDVNKYPISETEKITRANRKIGLGVMGFAEMLFKMRIPYNSGEGVKMGEKVMRFISEEARKTSIEIALERGSFRNFEGSVWDKMGYKAMRNASLTTIAPTGSISVIANTSSERCIRNRA